MIGLDCEFVLYDNNIYALKYFVTSDFMSTAFLSPDKYQLMTNKWSVINLYLIINSSDTFFIN
jgi:hypothetical protein